MCIILIKDIFIANCMMSERWRSEKFITFIWIITSELMQIFSFLINF